jgi:starch phosphorylase
VRRVAGDLLDTGGVPVEDVLSLGLGVDEDASQFDMTAFSLRLTSGSNAVSHLHAETANSTWSPVIDKEILGITNGIHGPTWIGSPIAELLEDLGADLDDLDASSEGGRFWERLERIPARQLWTAHLRQKRELAHFARSRLRSQFARHGEAPSILAELENVLDPGDPDRGLRPPLRNLQARGPAVQRYRPARPDAAGRATPDPDRLRGQGAPADRPGQRVIQEIFQRSRTPLLRGRVYILEDYDMQVGAVPRPGRGRLAQQPPPAARGVGHVGDEGGPERPSRT